MKDLTNKEFVQQYVAFRELKKAGFFAKEIKATDYDAITERFLKWFGTTKREYILNKPIIDFQIHPGVLTGKMPAFVDKDGNFNTGEGFQISLF